MDLGEWCLSTQAEDVCLVSQPLKLSNDQAVCRLESVGADPCTWLGERDLAPGEPGAKLDSSFELNCRLCPFTHACAWPEKVGHSVWVAAPIMRPCHRRSGRNRGYR